MKVTAMCSYADGDARDVVRAVKKGWIKRTRSLRNHLNDGVSGKCAKWSDPSGVSERLERWSA